MEGKKLYDLKNGVKDASKVVVEMFFSPPRCKKLVIFMKIVGWLDTHELKNQNLIYTLQRLQTKTKELPNNNKMLH